MDYIQNTTYYIQMNLWDKSKDTGSSDTKLLNENTVKLLYSIPSQSQEQNIADQFLTRYIRYTVQSIDVCEQQTSQAINLRFFGSTCY